MYLAIIWANATALPIIFQNIFGELFHFGFHYVIAGYDVYFGEILLSLASMLVFGLLCLRGGRTTSFVQTLLALLLAGAVFLCFLAVFLTREGGEAVRLEPLFAPGRAPAVGTAFIVFLGPWAFAGFESVSHSAEEFRFSPKKTLGILAAALAVSAAAYILLALIAAARRPAGYPDWVSYLKALGSRKGIGSMPVFFAVQSAMGAPGLALIAAAAAAAIITGFIGNLTAASRLVYAMARDELIPSSLAALNRHGAPKNAVLLLLLVSLPIPFLGRSAIGWIVDVNTVGVTIAYAYTAAAALREARREKKTNMQVFGILGLLVSFFFLFYFLIPNISSITSLSKESYFMLMSWAVLGFVVFYLLFRRDRARHRLGKSTLIWSVLLLLIFFTAMIWVMGTTRAGTEAAVEDMRGNYARELRQSGVQPTEEELDGYAAGLKARFEGLTGRIFRNVIILSLVVLLSLLIIFSIYGTVQKQRQSAVREKSEAEQSSQAKTNFLSNMSHDIRTPMNAIVGYVTLARREKGLNPRVQDYLKKIEDSSEHLLALINDVLEMSRIESGRMELMPVPTDIRRVMEEVRDLFITQMEAKGLAYEVDCRNVADPRVLCDRNRLNRVLQNLISNAYKFTPAGGAVTVTLRQTGRRKDKADFLLSVRDTGIGMSPEFAAVVFEAYEREKTAAVENIQGTGLGTAITKSIVELMGGTIQAFSKQGEGSEFVIRVAFPVDPEAAPQGASGEEGSFTSFDGLRLLLAEDNESNAAVEKALLESAGFRVDVVPDGEEAVEAVAASRPGEYAAVLLDIEMPVKNGLEAARMIRSLKNPALAGIPMAAVSAKAFSEDVAAAVDAGMNAHIPKPFNLNTALEILAELVRKDGAERSQVHFPQRAADLPGPPPCEKEEL